MSHVIGTFNDFRMHFCLNTLYFVFLIYNLRKEINGQQKKKTLEITKNPDSLLRVPFSVNKTEKFCVDRAAYFFLFFGRAADNRNE